MIKKIECVIPTQKFPDLERVLRGSGVHGMTVTEVKGYGNEQMRPEPYLLLPKTKVEIYSTDEDWKNIVAIISQTCRSGQLGDGKIAVFDVKEMVRIRTGECGEVAV